MFQIQKVKKMNFFQKIAHNFKFLLFGESVIREDEKIYSFRRFRWFW